MKRNFAYNGAKLWNNHPDSLKQAILYKPSPVYLHTQFIEWEGFHVKQFHKFTDWNPKGFNKVSIDRSINQSPSLAIKIKTVDFLRLNFSLATLSTKGVMNVD